jgi:hypothetical protein
VTTDLQVISAPGINTYAYFALAVIVAVLSAARLTRLVVADEYPPTIRLRIWWDTKTHDGPWSKLVHCPWCFGPWAALAVGAWGYLSNLHWTWWIFNAWLAISYAVSWVVFHDEDPHGD